MDLKFWPSLQLIAYARVARGILFTFDLEILKRDFMYEGRINQSFGQHIEERVSAISVPLFEATFKQLKFKSSKSTDQHSYLPIPNKIQKQLVGVVLALRLEIASWFNSHGEITAFIANFDVCSTLSWYSTGIIDRFETARVLIRNENLDIVVRLYFACQYHFVEDAQMIYTKMTGYGEIPFPIHVLRSIHTSYRLNELKIGFTRIMNSKQWLRLFEKIISQEGMGEDRISRERFIQNCMGIRFFFNRLNGERMKYLCLFFCLKLKGIHHYDLYSCLSEMNAEELNDIVTRLPQEELYRIFESFSCWPFQIMFLDVVNRFRTLVTKDIFLDLLCLIIHKLGRQWRDYPYEEILKDLWKAFSSQYGKYVEEDETLNGITKYVIEAPIPFNIEDFLNVINRCDTLKIRILKYFCFFW
ncbi:uncharacterized protein NPIL_10111 [Nephila pilipes]|uniref:Uncharacterized protein n=1 Tax=Nephila pilipes TaxID=299642 RepID=A0A8X6JPV9_NEPPI|nr:uncharacterized protein NPIL_10111 [Nephila pilipes]